VIEIVRHDLEEGLRALLSNAELREELREKALRLLDEMKISVQGADKSEKGRERVEDTRNKIKERIEKFLTELRLGENSSVCLVNCQFGEPVLTYKHEPYARIIAPLVHYIASNAPEEEVMRFLAYAVLFDGSIEHDRVSLMLGNFHVKEASKRLPLDMYDKIALYIILAAKYGVGIRTIFVGEYETILYFDRKYVAKMFSLVWGDLTTLWRLGRTLVSRADHIFKKLENIRMYVEEFANRLKIVCILKSFSNTIPYVTLLFWEDSWREFARIYIKWCRNKLCAYFRGAKEKAKRAASVLSALGATVIVKKYDGEWRVALKADSITAVRRTEWLDAVRALVEELHRRGIISGRQRRRLLREIDAGPNVVEMAGVEFTVRTKGRQIIIKRESLLAEVINSTVETLKSAGLEEGAHFIAKRPDGSSLGYVYISVPTGLWQLEELRRQGIDWADRALKRLEEIAKARGFYDVLQKHLRLAREAETVNPRGLVVEDPGAGVRAEIRDVRVEWTGRRPRVVIEYEAGGQIKSFSFIWGLKTRRAIVATVKLNAERALLLAALTGDGRLKGKRGALQLHAKHLLALTKYKGVGLSPVFSLPVSRLFTDILPWLVQWRGCAIWGLIT